MECNKSSLVENRWALKVLQLVDRGQYLSIRLALEAENKILKSQTDFSLKSLEFGVVKTICSSFQKIWFTF